MRKICVYLFMLILLVNSGCATCGRRMPDPSNAAANRFTPAQSRQIGLDFRELSDLLIRYRYQEWTLLNERDQYYIENIEWSLINYCTDYASEGISLYSEDAKALYCRITDRIEKASKQVRAIIDSRKEDTAGIKELGTWALKLGAAIASDNRDQVNTLLKSYTAAPDPKKPVTWANPEVARKIGLNFSKVSDLMLGFHYRNWDRLDSAQRSNLQNMEITILNYNSNFGGLGIKLGKGETEALMEQVLAKTGDFVTAMSRVAGEDANFYAQVEELGNRVMALGAALTEEDVPAVKEILAEDVTFDGYKLGRKMGLEFRNMASLLLKYRYANWDALTKKEKYHLENLEFTLTNFNSDFAVFGVRIDPDSEKALSAEIDAAIKRITDSLGKETLSYEAFFAAGTEGLKLGAAILTANKALIKIMAAPSNTPVKGSGDNSSDALARSIALKMRIIADTLLKQRYENWDCFTKKEGGNLGNIEWTLMNYTSNFSVLGIDLDSGERQAVLECAGRLLDTRIKTIEAMKPCDPADKKCLFQLGTDILKIGATLTTEDLPSIKEILGNCTGK